MPMSSRLAEKAVRLFKAAVLQGFLCLPESQPCKAEHNLRFVNGRGWSNERLGFSPRRSLLSIIIKRPEGARFAAPVGHNEWPLFSSEEDTDHPRVFVSLLLG